MTALNKIDPIVTDRQLLENGVALTLHIPENLDYFKGHFSVVPILAGVVQLHWAVEFAKANLAISVTDVKEIQVLKFQEVIKPGHDLVLTLIKKSPCKVQFSYQSVPGGDLVTKQHSSGRIVWTEGV